MRTRLALLMIFALTWLAAGCSDKNEVQVIESEREVSVVEDLPAASDGLDLKAVGELVYEAHNAEELEKKVNDPDINNLDLNGDGKVDYINVTESRDQGVLIYSLTTFLDSGQEQHLADIQIEKTTGNKANVQVSGNEQIYGSNNYYHHDGISFGEMAFLMWAFSPRPIYMSPYYGYGHYPGYWASRPVVSTTVYRTNAARRINPSHSYAQASKSSLSKPVVSPKASASASGVKAKLTNPTQSQKAFQSQLPKTKAGIGGFGKPTQAKTASPAVRSEPSRASSPSRSSPPPSRSSSNRSSSSRSSSSSSRSSRR